MSMLFDAVFWRQFREHLSKTTSKDTTSDRIQYAKKYYYVLISGNARDLLSLSNEKRLHIMKALTALSKYIGQYQQWKDIRERYQLKWSQEDNLNVFMRIIDDKKNYSSMINWVKDAYQKLPEEYGNAIIYCTLTGLRPNEACESMRILREDLPNYLNRNTMVLEHFRYPQIFIRRTKKEYISVVSEKILSLLNATSEIRYNAIKLATRRYGIEMNMSYCRKIFATHLRMDGIEPEVIDLLQGRIPKSVFARHYFRPDLDNNRIRKSVNHLYRVIS